MKRWTHSLLFSPKFTVIFKTIFGRLFVKRFALCYWTIRLSVLSVTLVYGGQMVQWIKMKLGMEVGLNPGSNTIRWRPSSPSPKRGTAAAEFSAHVLWPNGCMDKDATWYGGRPRPWPHVLDGDPAPTPKGHSPQFLAHVCCGKMAQWQVYQSTPNC